MAPLSAATGAALAGASGAAQVGIWMASEFAKFGKTAAGTPGEISAAVLGAGTGAMTGFFLGSVLGALSGTNMVRYFTQGLVLTLPGVAAAASSGDGGTERLRRFFQEAGKA